MTSGSGMRWAVVVPVKAVGDGKSRLVRPVGELEVEVDGSAADRAALVRAMAVDTVVAAAATPGVAVVVVVTPDEGLVAAVREAGAVVPVVRVAEPDATDGRPGDAVEPGLDAAVAAGVAAARAGVAGLLAGGGASRRAGAGTGPGDVETDAVAVLLGDLPSLRSSDLEDALALAAGHDRALVPDAAGTGTTLLTAWSTEPDAPVPTRFGRGSAQAHVGLGYVLLDDVPATSSVRHDVDVRADLALAERDGLGARTRAVLERLDRRVG